MALQDIKPGKALVFDGIYWELLRVFLFHCVKNAKSCFAQFFSSMMETGKIPNTIKQAKLVAILKPDKPNDESQSYRPLALLIMTNKLLEQLMYNRISVAILEAGRLPAE